MEHVDVGGIRIATPTRAPARRSSCSTAPRLTALGSGCSRPVARPHRRRLGRARLRAVVRHRRHLARSAVRRCSRRLHRRAWHRAAAPRGPLVRGNGRPLWPSVSATRVRSCCAVTANASTGARLTGGFARSGSVPDSAACIPTCCEPRSSWPPSTPASRCETSRSPPVTPTPEPRPSTTGGARTRPPCRLHRGRLRRRRLSRTHPTRHFCHAGQPARPRVTGTPSPLVCAHVAVVLVLDARARPSIRRIARLPPVVPGERRNRKRRSPLPPVGALPFGAGGWRRGCPRRGIAGTTRGAAHDPRRTWGSSWSRARTEPGR
jgi:hypothetical protein